MTSKSESNPQDEQVADSTNEQKLSLVEEMKQAFNAEEKEVTKDEEIVQAEETNEESADEEGKGSVEKDEAEVEEEDAEETTEKEFPLIPNNWSKDEREAFQKLIDSDNPELKEAAEIFIERHNSMKKTFFKKTAELANTKKELQPIKELFAPFEETMKQNNVDKATYMKNMIQWEVALQRDPVNTVKKIMETFNVKPEQIAPRKKDDFDFDEEQLTNTNESAKVSELEKELKLLRTQIANQPVLTQLRQFEEATDAKGKLKHPHFAEVKPIMGQLIQQGKAKTLEEAYSKAIKTLDLEETADDEPDIAPDLDKVRQRLVKAKKASKGVTTKGSKTDFTSMSIKDELRARLKH